MSGLRFEVLALVVAVCGVAWPASAAPVRLDFSGTVTLVNDPNGTLGRLLPDATFRLGDTFDGFLSLDPAVPPLTSSLADDGFSTFTVGQGMLEAIFANDLRIASMDPDPLSRRIVNIFDDFGDDPPFDRFQFIQRLTPATADPSPSLVISLTFDDLGLSLFDDTSFQVPRGVAVGGDVVGFFAITEASETGGFAGNRVVGLLSRVTTVPEASSLPVVALLALFWRFRRRLPHAANPS